MTSDPVTKPLCPRCGEKATYQTQDGTYWDSNAHYWRTPPAETPRLKELSDEARALIRAEVAADGVSSNSELRHDDGKARIYLG